MKELFLVRHGESTSEHHIYEEGREQITKLAERIKKDYEDLRNSTTLLSSPLGKAVESANILKRVLGLEENIIEEVKEPKTGKITIVSRKISVKKPVGNEEVEKEVSKLTKSLVTDVSESEINNFLQVSSKHKEVLSTGQMQITGRKNATNEERKELVSKLDEIIASDEVSTANAAFVLKWLKKRKNI